MAFSLRHSAWTVMRSAKTFLPMPRRARRWVLRTLALAILIPLTLQWMVAYVVGNDARLLPSQLQNAKNLLVVTAHPDDECLFFAPSILGVLTRNEQVHGSLLAISTGNNDGLGTIRTAELRGSCAALGIDSDRCIALDHADLQDNPKVWWDTELIKSFVRDHVKKWEVDMIITFDSYGVSGHINHRAVSAAIRDYVNGDPEAPEAYMVVSVPLWRKYTFLGDMPLTCIEYTRQLITAFFWPLSTSENTPPPEKALVANTWHRYLMTRQAFRQHNSQYSWDRHLYMVLSRYVWFNGLVRARVP